MHTVNPWAFVVVGAVLGTVVALFARRRGIGYLKYIPVAALLAWAVLDFVTTPADRWVNGIALAVAVVGGGVAYVLTHRSKADV